VVSKQNIFHLSPTRPNNTERDFSCQKKNIDSGANIIRFIRMILWLLQAISFLLK
jgi:hypothetical protein